MFFLINLFVSLARSLCFDNANESNYTCSDSSNTTLIGAKTVDDVLFIPKWVTRIQSNYSSRFKIEGDVKTIVFENESNINQIDPFSFYFQPKLTTVQNFPAVNVSDYLFSWDSHLSSFSFNTTDLIEGQLVIPETIVSIGKYSFESTNFTSILFEGTPVLSSYAFYSMPSLEQVINFSTALISPFLFYNCRKLNSFSFKGSDSSINVLFIPTNVSVGSSSFAYTNFTSIKFSLNSWNSFSPSAFRYFVYLEEVNNFPATNISDELFYYCRRLQKFSSSNMNATEGTLKISKSITNIGRDAFSFSRFKVIEFETGSTAEIGSYAFSYISTLTNVINLPSNSIVVEAIFAYDSNLNQLNFDGSSSSEGQLKIPNKVSTIGRAAFTNTAFSVINFEKEERNESVKYSIDFKDVGSVYNHSFFQIESLKSVFGFPKLEIIPTGLFGQCSNLSLFTTENETKDGFYVYSELKTVLEGAFDGTNFPCYSSPVEVNMSSIEGFPDLIKAKGVCLENVSSPSPSPSPSSSDESESSPPPLWAYIVFFVAIGVIVILTITFIFLLVSTSKTHTVQTKSTLETSLFK